VLGTRWLMNLLNTGHIKILHNLGVRIGKYVDEKELNRLERFVYLKEN
jgi:hypothetical protein